MKWIDVKDRLPEETESVILYDKGEFFIGHIQIIYSDGTVRFKETLGMYNIPASHWMPLPEPPLVFEPTE